MKNWIRGLALLGWMLLSLPLTLDLLATLHHSFPAHPSETCWHRASGFSLLRMGITTGAAFLSRSPISILSLLGRRALSFYGQGPPGREADRPSDRTQALINHPFINPTQAPHHPSSVNFYFYDPNSIKSEFCNSL